MDDSKKFSNLQKKCFEIFKQKNKDYGEAYKEYGAVGVLVRMNDKIKRFQNISKTGITLIKDEKIKDTLLDLSNYALMAVMLLDENENGE